jgi:hypothetical protein
VEDIKISIAMKYRSFPFGEGEGGWGLETRNKKPVTIIWANQQDF